MKKHVLILAACIAVVATCVGALMSSGSASSTPLKLANTEPLCVQFIRVAGGDTYTQYGPDGVVDLSDSSDRDTLVYEFNPELENRTGYFYAGTDNKVQGPLPTGDGVQTVELSTLMDDYIAGNSHFNSAKFCGTEVTPTSPPTTTPPTTTPPTTTPPTDTPSTPTDTPSTTPPTLIPPTSTTAPPTPESPYCLGDTLVTVHDNGDKDYENGAEECADAQPDVEEGM